jgi:hypothetical protein
MDKKVSPIFYQGLILIINKPSNYSSTLVILEELRLNMTSNMKLNTELGIVMKTSKSIKNTMVNQ